MKTNENKNNGNVSKIYIVDVCWSSCNEDGVFYSFGLTETKGAFKNLDDALGKFEYYKRFARDLCVYDQNEESSDEDRKFWEPLYEVQEKNGGICDDVYAQYFVERTRYANYLGYEVTLRSLEIMG